MEKIGFIGLGVMGFHMSKRLLESGYDLIVHDVDPKPVDALVELGARKAHSSKEAAQESDILFSMLPKPQTTELVMLGKGGAAEGFRAGSIYVDMSTSNPLLTKEICKTLKEENVEMLDAPVSGGMKGAAEGTLTIMVGGDREVFERTKPLFRSMGKDIYFVGDIGSGHTMKLVNNMLFAMVMAVTSEAMVFGQKNGMDLSVLREVINKSSGRSYATDIKLRDFVLPRNFTPGFAVDLQIKDLDLALQLGKDVGIPLVVATLVRQMYQTLAMKGWGGKDTSIIFTFFEELMGARREE